MALLAFPRSILALKWQGPRIPATRFSELQERRPSLLRFNTISISRSSSSLYETQIQSKTLTSSNSPSIPTFQQAIQRLQEYWASVVCAVMQCSNTEVILKPDPGNSQGLFIQSLSALGININEHDICFVEDNWESPVLCAWGSGWEIWMDGWNGNYTVYILPTGKK